MLLAYQEIKNLDHSTPKLNKKHFNSWVLLEITWKKEDLSCEDVNIISSLILREFKKDLFIDLRDENSPVYGNYSNGNYIEYLLSKKKDKKGKKIFLPFVRLEEYMYLINKFEKNLNILFLGDIVGKPGRQAVRSLLPELKKDLFLDMVIANGENASGGVGITPEIAYELLDYGVDVITTGNHIWDKKEIFQIIQEEERLLRPANLPPFVPGKGSGIYESGGYLVAVLNIMGRVFMPPCDPPFQVAEKEISLLEKITPNIIVDFHAEATSEKLALGWFLKARVSAVVGTHTHVQTADERIYPEKAAYISDVGMIGPFQSVLGLDPDTALDHFWKGLPISFRLAKGEVVFNALLINIDPLTGRALKIERIFRII